ncbi:MULTISPECIES: YopX family protein [Jeotgalibaca]|uniref:YopX family protein n=1 Tax=Jeotgalibaca TaxID=1470540 RepID=UPI0035A0897C
MSKTKFKAWDIQTESMRDVLVIDWVNELIDLSGGIIERRPHEVVLMQFTGLEDKNGVDICEGDIVEFIPFETSINNCVVKFERGTFKMELIRSGSARMLCNYREDEIEIIGNIYENPGLLEASK